MHSNWGDWFVTEEVESRDVDGVSIWYLGCNGLVIRSATTTLYVDPYFGEGNPPDIVRMIPVPMDPADATACDAVYVTHEHIDHMHPPSFDPLLAADDGTLYAPGASYEEADYDGPVETPADRRETVAVGDRFAVGDFEVTVCGANDPDAIEPVSYVISHDAGTIFHGGDSRPAEAFEDVSDRFDLDVGFLAFGTVGNIYDETAGRASRTRWYMDENQLLEAANQLELDRLVPTHYDMWKGVSADPTVLPNHAASWPHPNVIDVVEIGDRLELAEPGVKPPEYTER